MRLVTTGVMVFAALALAQPEAALKVYEEGKVLYDAKRYDEALTKFDEAARLEPEKARWQYNRGLALRKLKRDAESREALLKSLELDPTYKVEEIREKLGQLDPPPGPGPSTSGPSPSTGTNDTVGTIIGLTICAAFAAPLFVIAIVVLRLIFKKRPESLVQQQGHVPPPPRRAAANAAPDPVLAQRLDEAGQALTRVEHAMSLGEDAEARGHLDRGYTNFVQAKRALTRGGNPADLRAALERAGAAATSAEQRLRALRGAAFDGAQGPRVGCFFCARPLPTPESRGAVQLNAQSQATRVVTCLTCARLAATAEPPVTLINGAHWAQVQGLDPYVLAYSYNPAAQEAPLGRLARQGTDVATLAGLAGAAAAGAVAGMVVSRVLDVDALGEAVASADAATAAANAATAHRSSNNNWKDHS